MLEVRRYTNDDAERWDSFVKASRNATFLLERGYMDYHSDRFTDFSLMIWKGERLLAVMPANVKGDTLYSHGGLTYGGLIYGKKFSTDNAIDTFAAINTFLYGNGICHVVYKPTPWIYHTMPAEEDLYAIIQQCHARLTAREVSSTIPLACPPKFAQSRKGCLNKAIKIGITVRESADLNTFWNILDTNLENKYGIRPVHTPAELQLLKQRFPDRIRLFMAYLDDEPLGGTLIFQMPHMVHTQYISANPKGKECGAIDIIFHTLINKTFKDLKWLDFGKSTEEHGTILNHKLIFQKEGFGGRAVCYDTYEWDTTQHHYKMP